MGQTRPRSQAATPEERRWVAWICHERQPTVFSHELSFSKMSCSSRAKPDFAILFIAVTSQQRHHSDVEDLQERLKMADLLLSPNAVKHGNGLGREYDEPEDQNRFRFQRDRGRIVHTRSFRRLKGKTQVFIGGKNDHYRTRLTHTMEVAGISRDVARTLRLNEDLAECIALAHDLGHPPFGHAGEAALDEWLRQFGKSFEHNRQSHRIVTLLETHSSQFPGLNLNREVLEGILKHETKSPSLEAQLVNIADEIAYVAHDFEDGLRAGLFGEKEAQNIKLVADANRESAVRRTSLSGAIIHKLVNDLYKSEPRVAFTPKTKELLQEAQQFLDTKMYGNSLVVAMAQVGKLVIHVLCDTYRKSPNDVVSELISAHGSTIEEAVKDYVAGMTDAYALQQARELGVLPHEAEIL